MAPIVAAKTRSRTFALAAADAWSSSRPSNLAASLGSGLPNGWGSTAHDQNTLAVTPHHCAWSRPVSRRQRPPSADRDRQCPLRPPTRRSLGATSPSRSRPRQPTATPYHRRTRRRRSQSPSYAKYRRQIPIDRHHRRRQLAPRFPPLRLFGRLPPYARSRLCLAGVRKPLTITDVPQRFRVRAAQFVRKRAKKYGTRESASCRATVSVPSIRTTPPAVGNGNSRRGKLGQSKW